MQQEIINDEQFEEIRKAVVALMAELSKEEFRGHWWGIGAYKELKWVQYQPVAYGIECALVRVGKLLTARYRRKMLMVIPDRRLAELWKRR